MAARYPLVVNAGKYQQLQSGDSLKLPNLTTTRVPYANTNGELIDASGFTYASSVLTVPRLAVNTSGQTRQFNTYHAASNCDGYNIWIGGGGASSIGGISTLYGSYNVSYGVNALFGNTTGFYNMAIGTNTLVANTTGYGNLGVGSGALYFSVTGYNNIALGFMAGQYLQSGATNTDLDNCSYVGNDSRCSADNQVQLGNSATTTYAYGAVQDRSDSRDKADIRDTMLGLDFINALHPVDFKRDYREDYHIASMTGMTSAIMKIAQDGSKKGTRYHHGLIAQEVKKTLDSLKIDFGGYQDHKINGGCDVLSLGYTEFVAPLIKAVQELSAKVEKLEMK